MANTVRIVDATAFFKARQQKYTEHATLSRQRWDDARIEYEKGLRFRIFKTPFQATGKGSIYRSMFTEQWTFIRYERWAREAEQILYELSYHNAIGDERIEWRKDWEDDGWHISTFYAWCHEQGRPM